VDARHRYDDNSDAQDDGISEESEDDENDLEEVKALKVSFFSLEEHIS
jgi:hypothetical protein